MGWWDAIFRPPGLLCAKKSGSQEVEELKRGLPLNPPYPRRGIPGSHPRVRRGWGWSGFACFAPWRETGFLIPKAGEQSENVYENKGPARKSTAPGILFAQGGEFLSGSPPRMRRGWDGAS